MTETSPRRHTLAMALLALSGSAVVVSYLDALRGLGRKAGAFAIACVIVLVLTGLRLRGAPGGTSLARGFAARVVGWAIGWAALGLVVLALADASGWGPGQILPLAGMLGGALSGGFSAAVIDRWASSERSGLLGRLGASTASAGTR